MNRRGELERAIRRARLPKSAADVLLALLYRAGNDDGEVPAKFAVSLGRICADAKVSEWTVRRALAEATRHGWWVRYVNVPGKLSGLIMLGRDCDCPRKEGTTTVAACEWCGKPLAGKRAHARFCGDAHRKAATRAASRNADTDRTETRTTASRNADMSVQETRTVRAAEPGQPQVSPQITQEAATRKVEEETGEAALIRADRERWGRRPGDADPWGPWPAGSIGEWANQ